MSHAKGLPMAHGRSVAPSGRLSSCRTRLTRSLTAGICALLLIAIECRSCGYDVAVWVHSCDKLTRANHVHRHSFHMHMCVWFTCSAAKSMGYRYSDSLIRQLEKLWMQLITSHQNLWQLQQALLSDGTRSRTASLKPRLPHTLVTTYPV